MDLRQLRYFAAIYEQGGLSRAAEQCSVAVSALSHHLSNLEADYRTELFTRESRGMFPTAAGERLYVHAKSILKAVAAAEDDLRHARTEIAGEVSVVMAQSAIKAVGIDLFNRVVDEFPNLRLAIAESLSGSTLSYLMSNDVDIALAYNPPGDPSLRSIPLLEEEMVLVGTTPIIGNTDEPITFSEMVKLPLMLPRHGIVPKALIDDARLSKRLEGRARFQIDSLAALGPLLASGSACALTTKLAMQHYIAEGHVRSRRVIEPELWRMLFMCEKTERPSTFATEKVRQLIMEVVHSAIVRGRWEAKFLGALPQPTLNW
ncbi:LysR family transcriptional regulator [Bradyrhizobium diversitatis]|uniref:LysR family transcriptional regulator n=1 Tax=Bradyrhizobium diversitatis TaxID=2755406 RepID=A0ABS0PEY4_9BRAD|nr:LysR substrate-binding domain-containing protein [Bradyrhizobium diversitatis]MBH5391867.1 LysR family transcriptional regulator [Bradyrhizobium diversitatis]